MRNLFATGLKFDWKIVTITIVSTLALTADSYIEITKKWLSAPWWKYADRTILYFVIPMIFILLVFRENPREYGFILGDWRAGLILTLGGILLMIPILWFLNRGDASMQSYYQPYMSGLPWNTFADLFGWEFIFRGWILFGYARKFGPEALWLQAVPFALAHIGKPPIETFSTIFGGFLFGWVAWRTKSFVYPLLIHWFVASFTIVVAAGLLG
ncbi:MAG: abortive infection protein [Anaerolineaceae bacterium]|nr:MAG: abortive infection protein [Anaerolineaceae bacterium]